MKALRLFFPLFIIFTTSIYAQTTTMPPAGPVNLEEALNLNDKQAKKINQIFKDSGQKIEKLKKREHAFIKACRNSTKIIFDNTNSEILKLLNKNQAEKFKRMTSSVNIRNIMPPPPRLPGRYFIPEHNTAFPPRPVYGDFDSGQPGNNRFGPPPRMRENQQCFDDDNILPDLGILEMLFQDKPLPPDSLGNP